jgi:putative MATE family efflux protein
MTVTTVGLWLASRTSDVAAGAFGLAQQTIESLAVLFRVLAIGVGAVVAQALGGGREREAERAALAGLAAATWAGLLAAAAVALAHESMLAALNAPQPVLEVASPYLQALAAGLLLDAYNLTMASVLRAHLRARETLLVMLVMHAAHLALAAVLMGGIGAWDGLGLSGFAVAYAASRALGLALHLWLWRRVLSITTQPAHWWRPHAGSLGPALAIGVPGAALELGYRLAFLVSLAAGAKLGVAALATQAYTLQTLRYVLLVSLAIGWAVEIMVGRLTGAGDFRGAHRLVRKGIRNGMLASGGLALAAALAAPWLMQLFTRDAQVIALAQTLLWISLALETGRVLNLVGIGALRATGDAVYPVAASLASLVLVLGVGSTLLAPRFGLVGIWIAYVADEWIRGALMYWRWEARGWVQHARATHRRLQQPRSGTFL